MALRTTGDFVVLSEYVGCYIGRLCILFKAFIQTALLTKLRMSVLDHLLWLVKILLLDLSQCYFGLFRLPCASVAPLVPVGY